MSSIQAFSVIAPQKPKKAIRKMDAPTAISIIAKMLVVLPRRNIK